MVGNYVTQAGDQQLGEYWAERTGEMLRTTLPQEVQVAVPPILTTSTARAPRGDVTETRRRVTGGKRRRRPEHEAVSSESQAGVDERAARDVFQHAEIRTRSTKNGSSKRRKSAKDNDPQLPLGRCTRSVSIADASAMAPRGDDQHRLRRSRRRRT
ncbi:hypothetical protein PC120_g17672 [Phytophthora cactorum]|nr:hypothetical protein PC120_g17672 [Phytophthora cactorum]